MTFADVLPHLEAGRRVRRADYGKCSLRIDEHERFWCDYCNTEQPPNTSRALLASDWEAVEEPAPAKPDECRRCGIIPEDHCREAGQLHIDLAEVRATVARLANEVRISAKELEFRAESIARLTRELHEANDYAIDFKRTVERITAERDGYKASAERLSYANGLLMESEKRMAGELREARQPFYLTWTPSGWSWSRS